MTVSCTTPAKPARAFRAVTAVVALYALVLQALLGGIAALPAGMPFDGPCPQVSSGPEERAPGGEPAHRLHAGCCTLIGVETAAPPSVAATAIVWPERDSARDARSSGAVPGTRAPPGVAVAPRAPPIV